MSKIRLGKFFQYNPEVDAFRLFGKLEVWWRDGSWRCPEEWVFSHEKTPCGCHLLEVGFFGMSLLSKECKGRFW